MSPLVEIRGEVLGAEALITRLRVTGPEAARVRLKVAIRKLGYLLERNVRTNQLNGGVLKRQSGRLARSVNSRFVDTADTSTALVGTNLFYGRIWELTGSRGFTIVPRLKKALYWPGASNPYASVYHPQQAPRPWLRPALNQMGPVIHSTLADAMQGL